MGAPDSSQEPPKPEPRSFARRVSSHDVERTSTVEEDVQTLEEELLFASAPSPTITQTPIPAFFAPYPDVDGSNSNKNRPIHAGVVSSAHIPLDKSPSPSIIARKESFDDTGTMVLVIDDDDPVQIGTTKIEVFDESGSEEDMLQSHTTNKRSEEAPDEDWEMLNTSGKTSSTSSASIITTPSATLMITNEVIAKPVGSLEHLLKPTPESLIHDSTTATLAPRELLILIEHLKLENQCLRQQVAQLQEFARHQAHKSDQLETTLREFQRRFAPAK
jgi:hypothetical protein